MITGAWSVAWLLLAAGPTAQQQAVPSDVLFYKKKSLEFPITVDPARSAGPPRDRAAHDTVARQAGGKATV